MFTRIPSPSGELREAYLAILPELNEVYDKEVAPLASQLIELHKEKENLVARRNNLEVQKENLLAKSDRLDQEIAASKERQAQTAREVAQERQDILTRQFYSIFYGNKKLPEDEINPLFTKYLAAEKDLTVEKTPDGKSNGKINNMSPIIRYFDDHPNIKLCDLRTFKDQINDVGTLATYLADPSCKINAVAVKKCIPLEVKNKLEEAKALKTGLKICYYD